MPNTLKQNRYLLLYNMHCLVFLAYAPQKRQNRMRHPS